MNFSRIFSFLVLIFLVSANANAALRGTYTIDPTKPFSETNYLTIQDAISDLQEGMRTDDIPNGPGVSGPVIFKIADGVYEGPFLFDRIQGVSKKNTVTFQSASGDSTKVILTSFGQNSSNWEKNCTIGLNYTDYVVFKGLTIECKGYASKVIYINNSADFNLFTGNIIRWRDNTTTPGILIWYENSIVVSKQNVFANNKLLNATTALLYNVFNGAPQKQSGLVFKNNYLDSIQGTAIILDRLDSALIQRNTIVGVGSCISMSECGKKMVVLDNYLRSSAGSGISIGNSNYYSTNVLIANNFIQSMARAITLQGKNTIRIYNNSIRTDISESVYISNDTCTLVNNIISAGTGIALSVHGPTIFTSDNNNFYSSGSILVSSQGKYYKKLSDWIKASGKDNKSLSIDPWYTSKDDLHTQNPTLDEAGQPVAFITTDYDEELRNTTKPDIGADEFKSSNMDVAVMPAPVGYWKVCKGDTQSVRVTLVNYGRTAVDSATLKYRLNGGALQKIIWRGKVNPGERKTITLDTITVNGYETDLMVFDTLVNGLKDDVRANDTLQSDKRYYGMSGTYTIGAGGGSAFNTINDAILALKTRKRCGSVTFKIRNGTYLEKMRFNAFTGGTPAWPIIFQSESGDSSKVIITYAGTSTSPDSNYVLQIDSAKYMTFKGLTFQQAQGGNAMNVVSIKEASDITFLNNQVIGIPGKASLIVSAEYTIQANMIYKNNYLKNGGMGMKLGYTHTYNEEPPTTIEGNIIENCPVGGIEILGVKSVVVSNNIVKNVGSTGIRVSGADRYLGKVTNNRIQVYDGGVGLIASYVSMVANNEVIVQARNGFSTNEYVTGMNVYTNHDSAVSVVYNSVLLLGNQSKSYAGNISVDLLKNTLTVQNNSFVNLAGGQALWYSVQPGWPMQLQWLQSDYNNFSSGSDTARPLFVGYKTLKTWQATKQDLHSINIDPWFKTTSLQPANPKINNTGKSLSGFPKDITGAPRGTIPDIGAYEFIPISLDAGISYMGGLSKTYCQGDQTVKIRVRNYSSVSLTSLTVSWQINGVGQKNVPWTGTLLPGDSMDLSVGVVKLPAGIRQASSNVRVWISKPNGGTDLFPGNDTVSYVSFAKLKGKYTVGISGDYPDLKAAAADLKFRGVCGSISFQLMEGIHEGQVLFDEIPGKTSADTITIESLSGSSAGTVLRHPSSAKDSANYLLRFDKLRTIVIRNLTLERTGNEIFSNVVSIKGAAGILLFTGNTIRGTYRTEDYRKITPETAATLLEVEGDTFTNVQIKENVFKHGLNGIYFLPDLAYKTFLEKNRVDSSGNGMSISNLDSGIIRDNYIFSAWRMGMSLTSMRRNTLVERNSIILYRKLEGWPLQAGLYLGGGAPFSPKTNMVIINNMISVQNACGIYIATDDRFTISHNNVLVHGYSQDNAALYFNHYPTTQNMIMYNSLVNTSEGFAVYEERYNPDAVYIRNNAFTPKDLIYFHASLSGQHGIYLNPAALDGNFSDRGNFAVNPLYISVTDLSSKHLALDSAAAPIPEVSEDIDRLSRDPQKPDVGMNEFTVHDNDLSVNSISTSFETVCPDTRQALSVLVYNVGRKAQKDIPIRAEIYADGKTQVLDDTITASIPSMGIVQFTFDDVFSSFAKEPLRFKIYIALANDDDRSDDTFKDVKNVLSGTPIVAGTQPGCPTGITILRATRPAGDYELRWYADQKSAKPIAISDSTLMVRNLKGDTTFYVSAAVRSVFSLGDTGITPGASAFAASGYLPIQAFRTVRLESVKVYPRGRTVFTLRILKNGKAVFSRTYTIKTFPIGAPVTIPIDTVLAPGDYFIDYTAESGGLIGGKYYLFPDERKDVVRVGGNLGSTTSLFNITLSVDGCDNTTRVPVKVNMLKPLNPEFAKGSFFNGFYNSGTISDPDRLCLSKKASYAIKTAYNNIDYGKSWVLKFISVTDSEGISLSPGFSWTTPASSSNAMLVLMPDKNVKPGLYKISIIGTVKEGGCDTAIYRFIRLQALPMVSFKATAFCAGDTTRFIAVQDDNAAAYTWSFGDGSKATGLTTSHAFIQPGTYSVKLLIANKEGCMDSLEQNIVIRNKPRAVLHISGKCSSDIFLLEADTTGNGNASYSWSIDGQAGPAGANASYSFKTSGQHTISLKVKNLSDCIIEKDTLLTVPVSPTAHFDAPIKACAGDEIRFADKSSANAGSILSYEWDFGDTKTSGLQNPKHIYTKGGAYKVRLKVTNTAGCENVTDTTVVINSLPLSTFSAKTTSSSMQVDFTPDDTMQAGYSWDFGDGNSSTSKKPSHTYASKTTYTVKLRVTGKEGCKDSAVRSVSPASSVSVAAHRDFSLSVHPNPFHDRIAINYVLSRQGDVFYTIIDARGRTLFTQDFRSRPVGPYTDEIALTNIVPGIYTLQIRFGEYVITRKIIKLK